MKIGYLKKNNSIEIREENIPSPGKNQILIKIQASGICGTDIHAAKMNEEFMPFGHEAAGRIVEVGEGVEGLMPGQDIVLDSATPCGRCSMCKNAMQELCTDIQSFYYLDSFSMAEYMLAPAVSAIPYDGLTPEEAILSEPLGVALDIVRISDVQPGNNVLIMGPGPIGLMALRLVKMAGAGKIFVSALSSTVKRNQLAVEFGADTVIEVDKTPLEEYAFRCRIDRIISTTPPATLGSAFKVASKGAIISFIGLAGNTTPDIQVNADEFHFKKLQLKASFASPALFGPKAIEIIKEDALIRTRLISHRFPLSELDKAMDTAVNDIANSVKVVVLP